MIDMDNPTIVYCGAIFDGDDTYVSIVGRVMKLVGAGLVTLKKCGDFVEMILMRDFNGVLEHDYVLRSPFCPIRLLDNRGELCRILLEANFLDTDNGNKLYVNMFNGLEMALTVFKMKDRFGLLSKSFSELELKLMLRGF